MTAGVRVSFGVVADEVLPTLKNNIKGYKASKRAIQEIQGTYRKYETEAVRALRKTADATSKVNRIKTGLNDLVKRGVITEKRAAEAVQQTRDQLDGTAAARKRDAAAVDATRRKLAPILTAQKAIVRQLKEGNISRREAKRLVEGIRASTKRGSDDSESWNDQIRQSVLNYASVAGVIGTVVSGLREALALERERQDITREQTDSRLNFALLNEGNVASETAKVQDIARRAGFGRDQEEERQLFDIAQSLQSALGEEEIRTRSALRDVLDARLVGIQPETAKELVLQAKSQGEADTGTFIRRGLRSGQLSGRSAEEVSRNAADLNFIDDKDFGFSIAAKLTDQFGELSRTYVKAAGTALTTFVDRDLLGVAADATQEEVLRSIASQGIDTEAEFRAIGLSEQRRIAALKTLVLNIDEVLDEADEIAEVVNDQSFLRDSRKRLVQEDSIFGLDQEARRREVEVRQSRTTAESAERRLAEQNLAQRIDDATGNGEFLSATDTDGRVNGVRTGLSLLSRVGDPAALLTGAVRLGVGEMTRLQQENNDRMAEIVRNTDQAAKNLKAIPQKEQAIPPEVD